MVHLTDYMIGWHLWFLYYLFVCFGIKILIYIYIFFNPEAKINYTFL